MATLDTNDVDNLAAAMAKALDQNMKTPSTPSGTGGAATNNFAAVGKGIEGATSLFVKSINSAGGSLTGFSDTVLKVIPKIGGLGTALSSLGSGAVAYLEDTMGTFSNLSKMGASLSGDLGAFRKAAADTRMTLDDLAGMVANNSEALAGLGPGVSGGVRQFQQLSKTMMEGGTIDQFMRLGFTVEEANEFLLENTNMLNRQARLESMTRPQQLASAVEFAKQLDIMAKLTGRNARELREETRQRMSAGDTVATARLLEMQGVTGASQALQASTGALATAPQTFQDAFNEIYKYGNVVNQDTIALMALNSEAESLLIQSAAAAREGNEQLAKQYADQAYAALQQNLVSADGLRDAQLGGISDIGRVQMEALEQQEQQIRAVERHRAQMEKNQGREVTMAEARADLAATLAKEQSDQVSAAGDGQQAMRLVTEAQQELRDASSKLNANIAEQISSNTELTDAFREGAQNLDGAVQRFVDIFEASNLPPEVAEELQNMEQVPTTQPAPGTTTGEVSYTDAILRMLGISGRYTGGSVSPGKKYLLGERGAELFEPATAGTVTNNAGTANALAQSATSTQQGMDRVVDQLAALNDKTDALLRINTKQTSLTDQQMKAIRGAGNLLRGVT